MTQTQIIDTLRAYQDIEERAYEIADKMLSGKSNTYFEISFEDTDLDDPENATFTASWEEYHCSCCGADHHSEQIPLRFLFIEDEDELQAAIQAHKDAEAKAAAEKKRQEELRKARQEAERARIKAESAQRIADAKLEAAQAKLAALEAA